MINFVNVYANPKHAIPKGKNCCNRWSNTKMKVLLVVDRQFISTIVGLIKILIILFAAPQTALKTASCIARNKAKTQWYGSDCGVVFKYSAKELVEVGRQLC